MKTATDALREMLLACKERLPENPVDVRDSDLGMQAIFELWRLAGEANIPIAAWRRR